MRQGGRHSRIGLTQRVLTNLPRLLTWLSLIFVVYLVTSDPVGSGGGRTGGVGRGGKGAGASSSSRVKGGGAGGHLRGKGRTNTRTHTPR